MPEPPAITDLGALPEAPALDDAEAVRAWREALTALSFDHGKEAGQKQGLAEALFTILAARGIPLDAEARTKIEACTDPAVLHRWLARAATIEAAPQLFTAGP